MTATHATRDDVTAGAAFDPAAAVEYRQERSNALLRTYTDALLKAQTSHDPWDWLTAGSAFKRFAEAETAAQFGSISRVQDPISSIEGSR